MPEGDRIRYPVSVSLLHCWGPQESFLEFLSSKLRLKQALIEGGEHSRFSYSVNKEEKKGERRELQ